MSKFFQSLVALIEKHSFGVCSYIADKCNLQESKVRMYFIYSSFLTFGSPAIIYLVVAFWINVKKYIRSGFGLYQ